MLKNEIWYFSVQSDTLVWPLEYLNKNYGLVKQFQQKMGDIVLPAVDYRMLTKPKRP